MRILLLIFLTVALHSLRRVNYGSMSILWTKKVERRCYFLVPHPPAAAGHVINGTVYPFTIVLV